MKKSTKVISILCIITISSSIVASCYYHNMVSKNKYDAKLNKLKKKEFVTSYKNMVAKVKKEFGSKNKSTEFHLVDSVLPYWYGTKWDFNGVTQTPRKGKIACGYFVTNTLSAIGHPLKRIWNAQQAASVLIKRVCNASSIKTFTGHNEKGLKAYMTKGKEGLYLIGLDNHVGYVYKKAGKFYFIHSNNWPHRRVIREDLMNSKNIKGSGFHMIGKVNLFK